MPAVLLSAPWLALLFGARPRGAPRGTAVLTSKQGLGWADPASALAAAKLATSQDALFSRLVRECGDVADEQSFALGGGSSATVRSFEAAERKVAWCTASALREARYGEEGARAGGGKAGSSLTAISCWLTPTIEVPNLFVCAGIADGGVALEIDFRPRLNAAYHLVGKEPSTRDEFAQV